MHSGVTITEIQASAKGVTGVTAQQNGQPFTITADYYIAAMPVEIMAGLVTGSLKTFAPALAGLSNLKVRWMNGIQFYLAKDVPVAPGHTLVRRFAVGADLDFTEAVLARCSAF